MNDSPEVSQFQSSISVFQFLPPSLAIGPEVLLFRQHRSFCTKHYIRYDIKQLTLKCAIQETFDYNSKQSNLLLAKYTSLRFNSSEKTNQDKSVEKKEEPRGADGGLKTGTTRSLPLIFTAALIAKKCESICLLSMRNLVLYSVYVCLLCLMYLSCSKW